MSNSPDSPIGNYDKSNDLFDDYLTCQHIRNGLYEHSRNLMIGVNHPTGTTDTTVDMTADYITVEGVGYSSLNLTCDLSVAGAGGLDTGSLAASTFYYLWLISSARGELISLIASLSATAPTMPGQYMIKRRIGAVRTNGSAKLFRFYFVQNGWFLWNESLGSSPFTQTLAETVTFTAVTLTAPSAARLCRIGIGTSLSVNAGARPTGSNWAYNLSSLAFIQGDAPYVAPLDIATNSSQQIDVRSGAAAGGTITVVTHGFWLEV